MVGEGGQMRWGGGGGRCAKIILLSGVHARMHAYYQNKMAS